LVQNIITEDCQERNSGCSLGTYLFGRYLLSGKFRSHNFPLSEDIS